LDNFITAIGAWRSDAPMLVALADGLTDENREVMRDFRKYMEERPKCVILVKSSNVSNAP
jgi:hypothetical protein